MFFIQLWVISDSCYLFFQYMCLHTMQCTKNKTEQKEPRSLQAATFPFKRSPTTSATVKLDGFFVPFEAFQRLIRGLSPFKKGVRGIFPQQNSVGKLTENCQENKLKTRKNILKTFPMTRRLHTN